MTEHPELKDFSVVMSSGINEMENPSVICENIKYDDFIVEYPKSVYTSARTVGFTRILALESHFTRLGKSLELYLKEDEERETNFKIKLTEILGKEQANKFNTRDFWEERLLPWIKTGLLKFNEQVQIRNPKLEIKSPSDTTPSRQLSDFEHEAKVSFSVSVDPILIRMHITRLYVKEGGNQQIILAKGERTNPTAKHTHWVQERKKLQSLIIPPVNEVVLVNPNTLCCTEGLSSNFFVVEKIVPSFHGGSQSNLSRSSDTSSEDFQSVEKMNGVESIRNFRLVCTPIDKILTGTIMQIVLQICKEDKIPIIYKSAALSGLQTGQWAGAFITSTSRLVLPISGVKIFDRSNILSVGYCPLVEHIKKRVFEHAKNESFKVL
ncbi:hypothetical protein BB559_001603 [Furculomyces boomerangus]|uniref:Uncharacterized protein n=1 Tax=Furculomyces boomerangus TaxID=61424 RepID=A0A2T9Z1C1_9FUNG|nr:hypothetical protein BB559_001603 [Furculomyces boomerangus]